MSSQEKPALKDIDYNTFIESISNATMLPKDQLTVIKSIVRNNTITCQQLAGIIKIAKAIQVEIIVLCYPSLSDPSALETEVLPILKWQEERQEVKKKLGL